MRAERIVRVAWLARELHARDLAVRWEPRGSKKLPPPRGVSFVCRFRLCARGYAAFRLCDPWLCVRGGFCVRGGLCLRGFTERAPHGTDLRACSLGDTSYSRPCTQAVQLGLVLRRRACCCVGR